MDQTSFRPPSYSIHNEKWIKLLHAFPNTLHRFHYEVDASLLMLTSANEIPIRNLPHTITKPENQTQWVSKSGQRSKQEFREAPLQLGKSINDDSLETPRRTAIAILSGKVVLMEFPLEGGDQDFGAMELGSPLRYVLSLSYVDGLPRNMTKAHESTGEEDIGGAIVFVPPSVSLDYESSILGAQVVRCDNLAQAR